MEHRGALVAFKNESCNGKFADMVRSVFVTNLQAIRYIGNRELWFPLEEIEYLQPPMIGEAFHNSFEPPKTCLYFCLRA